MTIYSLDVLLFLFGTSWELKQGLCTNLEGWNGGSVDADREVQEGGDICIPMADLCWGLTENNKIL